MGEAKPWLETWTCTVDGPAVDVEQVSISGIAGAFHGLYDVGQAAHGRLIAAAPLLVRALLAVENEYGAGYRGDVDAALTAAGLDTAKKRDTARAEIARMAK